MQNVAPKSSTPFPQAAWTSAKRAAILLLFTIALLALVGKVIEERIAIRRYLLSL